MTNDNAEGKMSDTRRLEIAIGYAPITASFPGGGGGLTHMAAIDRDRIVRDVLAAGFGDVAAARAEAWTEGALWAAVECGAIESVDVRWLAPGDNPHLADEPRGPRLRCFCGGEHMSGWCMRYIPEEPTS